VARLVADLEELGFRIVVQDAVPARESAVLELSRERTEGVHRVRITEDLGTWEVDVQVGEDWIEPFAAMQALDGRPAEAWALTHEQRRTATLEFVRRLDASP
jgi:hypothetical protein